MLRTSERIVADADTHNYFFPDGKPLNCWSVTEVLAAANINTKGFEFVPEEALELGSAVHEAMRLHIKGTLDQDSVHPEVRPYLDAGIRFLATGIVKVVEAECAWYCPTLDLKGRIDLFGKSGYGFVIIDWKKCPVPWWAGLQTAGYDLLMNNGLPTKGLKRWGVHLDPDCAAGGRIRKFEDPSDYDDFKAALRIVRRLEREGVIKKPKKQEDANGTGN